MPSKSAILAGAAYVKLTLDSAEMANGMKQAQTRFKSFANDIRAWSSQMSSIGAIAQLPVTDALNTFREFETRMLRVKAVTSANVQEFRELSRQARILGRDTTFTANDIAEAMLVLGKMGMSVKEIQNAIAPVMNLARATGTDFASSAEIATNLLRVFNIDAKETARISDLLTVTANNSAQSLLDVAESAKKAGPRFAIAGYSLEDMLASLGVLANMGIKGEFAGTALGRAITTLADEKVRKKIEMVGGVVRDASGDMRPLFEQFREIARIMQDMNHAERIDLAKNIFGERGLNIIPAVWNMDKIDDFIDKLNEASEKANKAAREMESGIDGTMERLKSAFQDLKIEGGENIANTFTPLLESVTGLLKTFTQIVKENKTLLSVMMKIGAVYAGIAVSAKIISSLATAMKVVMSPFKALDNVVSNAWNGKKMSSLGAMMALDKEIAQSYAFDADARFAKMNAEGLSRRASEATLARQNVANLLFGDSYNTRGGQFGTSEKLGIHKTLSDEKARLASMKQKFREFHAARQAAMDEAVKVNYSTLSSVKRGLDKEWFSALNSRNNAFAKKNVYSEKYNEAMNNLQQYPTYLLKEENLDYFLKKAKKLGMDQKHPITSRRTGEPIIYKNTVQYYNEIKKNLQNAQKYGALVEKYDNELTKSTWNMYKAQENFSKLNGPNAMYSDRIAELAKSTAETEERMLRDIEGQTHAVHFAAMEKAKLTEEYKKSLASEKKASKLAESARAEELKKSKIAQDYRNEMIGKYGADVFTPRDVAKFNSTLSVVDYARGIENGSIALSKAQANIQRYFKALGDGDVLLAALSKKHASTIAGMATRDLALTLAIKDGCKKRSIAYMMEAASVKLAASSASLFRVALSSIGEFLKGNIVTVSLMAITAVIAAQAKAIDNVISKIERYKDALKSLQENNRKSNEQILGRGNSHVQRLESFNEYVSQGGNVTQEMLSEIQSIIDELSAYFGDLGVNIQNTNDAITELPNVIDAVKKKLNKEEEDQKLGDAAINYKNAELSARQIYEKFMNFGHVLSRSNGGPFTGNKRDEELLKTITDAGLIAQDQVETIESINTQGQRFSYNKHNPFFTIDRQRFMSDPKAYLRNMLNAAVSLKGSGNSRFVEIGKYIEEIHGYLTSVYESTNDVKKSSEILEKAFDNLNKEVEKSQENEKEKKERIAKELNEYNAEKNFEKDYNKFSDASAKYILEQERKSYDSYLSKLNPFQMINAINSEMSSIEMSLDGWQKEYNRAVRSANENGFYKSYEEGGMDDLQKAKTSDYLNELAGQIEEKMQRQEDLANKLFDAQENLRSYDRRVSTAGNFSASALSSSLSSDQQYRNSVRQYLQNILASVNASRIAQQKTATNTNGISTLGTVQ